MRGASLLIITLLGISSAVIANPGDADQLSAVRIGLQGSSRDALTIRFETPDLKPAVFGEPGAEYTLFPLGGEGSIMENGAPVLPMISRFIAIPPTANVALEVRDGASYRIRAETPPSFTRMEELNRDGSDIRQEGLFPPQLAEISDPFVIRGVRFVRVIAYPVQYDFGTGEFVAHPTLETEVKVVPGEPVNPVTGFSGVGKSIQFRRFLESYAINGADFLRDDPDYNEEVPLAGHYLVATNHNCLQYMVPFIEWRRKAGYRVDIQSFSDGNEASNTGTIDNRIQGHWDNLVRNGGEPFDYLLLVGDRDSYNYGPQAGWRLAANIGTSLWQNPPHADYEYARLNGQDDFPDVAYGRFAAGSQETLELVTGKALAYEMTPNMDDPSWFTRGGVYSQHWGNTAQSAWHISIHTNVRWGVELLQSKGFDDVQFQEEYDWDQFGHELGPWIADRLNEKTSVLIGRGENYYFTNRCGHNHSFEEEVDDNDVFAINLCTSGHGEWSAERMYRSGSRAHLKGYVSVTFGWGGPGTMMQTAVWIDLVRGVLAKDLPVGWGWMYAANHFESYFPQNHQYGGRPIGPLGRTDNNHFGDPGLKVWVGVPREVEVTAPAIVAPETRLVEAFVHLPDNDTPVPGARVTFYAPGNLPIRDMNSYKNYDDMFMWTTFSDAEGMARLVIPDGVDLVDRTKLYVTVTGDDIVPFFHEADIRTPEAALEIGDWAISEVSGNGDDEVNPGERWAVSLQGLNLGEADAEDVSATITPLSPFIELPGENQIFFGGINAESEVDGDRAVELLFSTSSPDAEARPEAIPRLHIELASGESVWRSAIKLPVIAPRLSYTRVMGGNVIPDSVTTIDIEIANKGRISSGEIAAELSSLGGGVTIIDGVSSYPEIGANRTARLNGGRFEISGTKVVVPGSKTRMMLRLVTASGFVDTTYFELQVMQPRAGAPIGPDPYGYICFDDLDTTWDVAPDYNWVEIDPRQNNADFEGTRLNLDAQMDFDIGDAIVVPLPFTTQLYGREFDTITVATNGFIGMGVQPLITNYQNWPLDAGVAGAVGMLAPFWDDLRIGQNSGVYVYYDEDDSRFIIEWSRMRPASGDRNQTFQAIIYDKNVWITESGDPNILFQYKEIENLANVRNGDNQWVDATPYASVGISGFHGEGLNYTWNNQYPTGAAQIGNRRAILFTTATRFKACGIYGYVTDVATGQPIEGATVFTKHGFVATTDADGYWRIGEALAEVPFDISARMQGYNDSTYTDLEIAEHDSMQVDFALLHPEFALSSWRLVSLMDPGFVRRLPLSLTNTGNGPLFWSSEKRLYGDANAAPWELRRTFAAGDSANDDRCEGVVFANEHFFVSGANGANPSQIYVLDRSGQLVRQFDQAGSSRYGFKDLDWDGQLLWGSGDTAVYGCTPEGELVSQWRAPLNPCNNIAYDSERDILWISGVTTNIFGCTRDGEIVDTLNRKGFRMYGLAYWPEDPDGKDLYIVHVPGQNSPTQVYKMDTETGDTTWVRDLVAPEGATGIGGCWITNAYDVYSWVLMTMPNIPPGLGGDRIQIYQLDARKDWFQLAPTTGVLQAGETQEFEFIYNSIGLPDTTFNGEIRFYHNADSSIAHLDLSLDIIGPLPPEAFDLLEPANGDTITALPLYGDTLRMPAIQFTWTRSFDLNIPDSLITYRLYITAQSETFMWQQPDTTVILNIDTLGLPIWSDIGVNWAVTAVSNGDTAICRSGYSFYIEPDDVDREKFPKPVEFGLHSIYPSPFNGRTTIRFGADKAVRTTLVAYDLSGRQVARLFDAVPRAGYYSVAWNAEGLASGVYMLKLESAGRSRVAKLALVK